MKYLKLFEKIKTEGLSPTDFIENSYWRFRNSYMDSIMKVEEVHNDRELWQVVDFELKEKILRPATKEEIEQFEI